jgi:MFS transporter, Spinster family, sphingosine-1-phosphate transporter
MSDPTPTTETVAAPSNGYRLVVMLLLFVIYAFNFLDRQIISILAIPIQSELGLSDRQLGLLGGIAFALLYSTLAVPIAWLADRSNRTWIITAALSIWSGFTVLCGFAQNFGQLFLARVGVGVGEAGGVAPSYSLIADFFPPQSRARALAFYSLGIPIGSAFGVIVGSQIAGGAISDNLDWRAAFIVVGLAGLVLAPIFRLIMREPARGRLDTIKPDAAAKKPRFLEVLGVLSKKPAFWLLTLGASCSSMMGYGVFFWLPSFFSRTYGLDIIQTGWMFGSILFFGGTIGIILGGVMGDLMGKRGVAAYARVPAIAFAMTTPLYIAGVMAPNALLAVGLFMVPTALGLAWLGPTLSAFQNLVPASMRTTASAIFLLVNNLLGIGGGVYVLGELSTLLTPMFGIEALRYSIVIGSLMYLLASLLFFLAAPRLKKDWEG